MSTNIPRTIPELELTVAACTPTATGPVMVTPSKSVGIRQRDSPSRSDFLLQQFGGAADAVCISIVGDGACVRSI